MINFFNEARGVDLIEAITLVPSTLVLHSCPPSKTTRLPVPGARCQVPGHEAKGNNNNIKSTSLVLELFFLLFSVGDGTGRHFGGKSFCFREKKINL